MMPSAKVLVWLFGYSKPICDRAGKFVSRSWQVVFSGFLDHVCCDRRRLCCEFSYVVYFIPSM